MEAFTAFFKQDGRTYFRVECYAGTAMHFSEYVVDDERKLESVFGSDPVVRLTQRFSMGNGVLAFLRERGIPFTEIHKGFADTSSDV